MRQRQETIAHELAKIMKRQQQLEATNERLQDKAVDIRRSLTDVDLTDSQYQQLRLMNEDDIPLKDFVAVCMSLSSPKIYLLTRLIQNVRSLAQSELDFVMFQHGLLQLICSNYR